MCACAYVYLNAPPYNAARNSPANPGMLENTVMTNNGSIWTVLTVHHDSVAAWEQTNSWQGVLLENVLNFA